MRERDRKRRKRIRAAFIAMLLITLLVFTTAGYFAISAAVEKRSPFSKLVELCIDVVMPSDEPVAEADTTKAVEKRRKTNENYKIPTIYKTLYGFSVEEYEGCEIAVFDNEGTDKTAVYFHGGSYMWQPLIVHYDYCKYLSEKLCLDIIMPLYPLAPNYDYNYTLDWTYKYYTDKDIDAVAFFGDSAGGGLALSFTQYLIDRNLDTPDDIILFSPCLDLSLNNPEIEKYRDVEPMLNIEDLRRKFAYYIDDGEVTDPYLSPIYCDFGAMPEVTIFVGTHEILYPDTKKWDEQLTAQGIKHNYYVFENQFHTFAIVPIPEREPCLAKIKQAIK